jgi:hypothetical protein
MIDNRRRSARTGCLLSLLFLAGLVPRTAFAEKMSYLENDQIKIGVDLDLGGSITYLALSSDGKNLVNSHDFGRQIQQSYYSGPQPFGNSHHRGWENWPWNPIGTGDAYGNHGPLLQHTNDGRILHVEAVPMQWALRNVPGDCTIETWIELEANAAWVRCRLNNHRDDKTEYPARDQELPAVYCIGELHRLLTYDGTAPFTGGLLHEIKNVGPPWASWEATENWAALVDQTGNGVGIVHPGVLHFIGGFNSQKAKGGPKDNSTGYMSPVRQEILDHNIVYEYRYALVVGSLASIRACAVDHRVKDSRPDYHFAADRQHWIYVNLTDTGFPIKGNLWLKPGPSNPQMIGPEQLWDAKTAPKLYIRAAFRGQRGKAAVYWSTLASKDFEPERRVEFRFIPDGNFHNYVVNVGSSPNYRGMITRLRFDPVVGPSGNLEVALETISWKPAKMTTGAKSSGRAVESRSKFAASSTRP